MFVVSWLQTALPKTKGVNMYAVDCKIEESLADNNINIDITKTRSWMFVVNWLQTVLPKIKGVNMYVVDCKIEESLADNNINIDITKTWSVNVCC